MLSAIFVSISNSPKGVSQFPSTIIEISSPKPRWLGPIIIIVSGLPSKAIL